MRTQPQRMQKQISLVPHQYRLQGWTQQACVRPLRDLQPQGRQHGLILVSNTVGSGSGSAAAPCFQHFTYCRW